MTQAKEWWLKKVTKPKDNALWANMARILKNLIKSLKIPIKDNIQRRQQILQKQNKKKTTLCISEGTFKEFLEKPKNYAYLITEDRLLTGSTES